MESFDHARIREAQDRSWTLPLLDVVDSHGSTDEGWTEAVETLGLLEDHRAIGRLRAVLFDLDRPLPDRSRLAGVLSGFDLTTTPRERQEWWRSGDEAVQIYALCLMESRESSVVAEVAADDGHPLRAKAVAALEWGFEEPAHQELKVSALRSARPEVRAAAAWAVSWDEPAAAEPGLRHLLTDEDPDVALAAAYATQYFPSLAALDALRSLPAAGSEDLARQRSESLEFIEGTIAYELVACSPAQRRALSRWAEAVDSRSPEANDTADGQPDAMPGRHRPAVQPLDPVADPLAFEEALDTTSGSFTAKAAAIRSIVWGKVPTERRTAIGDRMAGHIDPEIRCLATTALAGWGHGDALVDMLDDAHLWVRKLAMFALGEVAPDPLYAAVALDRLPSIPTGNARTEAFTTFAHHAEPAHRATVLFDQALTSTSFSARVQAVELLDRANALSELARLAPLLDDPPFVNWQLHAALLSTEVAGDFDPGRVAELIAVDDITVATAAARVRWPVD